MNKAREMSASSDDGRKTKQVVCENCEKSTQKELPDNSLASQGMVCSEAYQVVSACMVANKGQIFACSKEWETFRYVQFLPKMIKMVM